MKNSKNIVFVAAPIGDFPQVEFDQNVHQEHKSKWSVKEMQKLGYGVRSQGLKILWGNENVIFEIRTSKLSNIFYFLAFISNYFT